MTATQRLSIMVIDDSFVNNILCEDILSDAGYKPIIVDNSLNAFEKVTYYMPDVILLDIMMPGIDGLEILKMLKNNNSTKSIPVLMLTANTNTQSLIAARSMGAKAVITKPFVAEELLAKIETCNIKTNVA